MPAASPHLRLLLRGSAALIALATIWWFLLVTPLVVVFRNVAELLGSLAFGGFSCETGATTASGEWKVCVPVDMVVPNRQHGGTSHVHSVDFEVERTGLFSFTFALPIYWAIILATPLSRSSVRPLVLGTAVTTTVEIAFLLLFLKTRAHLIVSQSYGAPSAVPDWFYFLGQYLSINVTPNVIPFLVALYLHRELRTRILGGMGAVAGLPQDPGITARSLRAPNAASAGRRR